MLLSFREENPIFLLPIIMIKDDIYDSCIKIIQRKKLKNYNDKK